MTVHCRLVVSSRTRGDGRGSTDRRDELIVLLQHLMIECGKHRFELLVQLVINPPHVGVVSAHSHKRLLLQVTFVARVQELRDPRSFKDECTKRTFDRGVEVNHEVEP